MFNSHPLHHVFTAEEEADLLYMFEENLENIDGIEDAIASMNDPKFDSPVWDGEREKLKEIRMQQLEVNYKCQVLLVTLGLYDSITYIRN